MDIILFVFLKCKQSINILKINPQIIIYNLILLILTILFAIGLGNVLYSSQSGLLKVSPLVIKSIIYGFIFIFTFAKDFIPHYSPLVELIPTYYPVKRYKATVFNIVNDYISSYYLYVLLFLLILTIYSNLFKIEDFIICTLILFNCRLISRILQNLLEFKIKFALVPAIIIIGIVALIVFFVIDRHQFNIIILGFIIFILLLTINILIESLDRKQIISNNKINIDKELSLFSILIQLFNNIAFRTSILLFLSIKVLFISSVLINTYVDQRPTNDKNMWIFLSPILLFSFIFNNFWGFFRSIWINFYLRNNSLIQYLVFYLKTLVLPLIIDFILTLTYFVTENKCNSKNIIIYFAITYFYVCFGFFSSFYFPKLVVKKIAFKQTASTIMTLICISYLLFFIYLANLFFLILLLVNFIIGFVIILYLRNRYKYNTDRVYNKLFKSF